MNKKVNTALLSVLSNSILTLLKLVVGVFMGSISVISEAIHSGIDLIASVIAYLSVRQSSKPADPEHPYGHGKYENVASIVEAVLIIVAAVVILTEAVPRLLHPSEIHSLGIGVGVMAVSVVVNILVSSRLMKVARETDSPALEGDALHLRTDVYTSLGIFAGLAAIKLTGLMIIDPLIAIGVSLLIMKTGCGLVLKSFRVIVDERLSEGEINAINDVLEENSVKFLEYHELRTRKAGSRRFIDLHLVFPRDLPVKFIYDTCRELEEKIEFRLSETDVVIKVEPCDERCVDCSFDCKQ
ncbi:MAG: cation transporter [Peptococcaceae bacterium BICA1-7]|nr:MAG: cation transporter [Peptococcaceae bacterium BICA1-7]HBV97957.1 cation transporter [Desulfotomaculum sp.]